ncbi:hypothetical protein IYY11_07210 [Methylocystis sp. H62]|uniref:N,N-dimethylformamidase beta subunit family domain-containing protein n=1 Tax=Methylocystis sp. H62 TaxID=2785789 RepID=UPI0018C25C9E|nr:N,N-dimethylformamidase beta subunit family domain-containing protein [Methylocystis sp. H62]MBG0793175.1 hypothetical protein [Methylocystis sp. H62]
MRDTIHRRAICAILLLYLAISFESRIAFSQESPLKQGSDITDASSKKFNAIEIENALGGTTSWKLTNPATAQEIEGYASLTSVNKGSAIDFFVSTSSPTFIYQVYRMGWYAGAGGRSVLGPTSVSGGVQETPSIDPEFGTIDCNWKVSFSISGETTRTWTTGFYLVKLTANSGKQSYIIFVVRDDATASKFLFQSAVANWQAYNSWPGPPVGRGVDGGDTSKGIGKSIYCPDWVGHGGEPRGCGALKVSFNRPYAVMNMGSTGGKSNNPNVASTIGSGEFLGHLNSDLFDTVGGWEYNMVRFIEREGFDVSYITSIDTHQMGSAASLLKHKVLLSVGHDEYWSRKMRENVEAARDAGLSLAFFSSNTSFWQVRFEPSGDRPDRIMVAFKNAGTGQAGDIATRVTYLSALPDTFDAGNGIDLKTHLWRNANNPEVNMLGTGGVAGEPGFDAEFNSRGSYLSVPFVPANVDGSSGFPWLYTGTGASDGERLRGLIGLEVEVGTRRPGAIVIGKSPYGSDLTACPPCAEATIYDTGHGSTVFNANTVQWSWGLDDYDATCSRPSYVSETAQQITRNVLKRLSGMRPTWKNSFSESFYSNVVDAGLWDVKSISLGPTGQGIEIKQGGGVLSVAPALGASGLNFAGYATHQAMDFTNMQASVEVTQTTSDGNSNTYLAIAQDANNWYRIIVQTPSLLFQSNENGSVSTTSIDYVGKMHRWWRLRSVRSQVFFETSADNVEWQVQRKIANPNWIASAYVEIGAGSYAPASSTAAKFRNFSFKEGKQETLSEDFSAFFQDRSKWITSNVSATGLGGAGCVSQGEGALEIRMPFRQKRPASAYPVTAWTDAPNYTGYVSRDAWDFTNRAVTIHLAESDSNAITFFGIAVDNNNAYRLLRSGQLLFLEKADGGNWTAPHIQFDPIEHAWWRVRHAGSSVFLETSADGSSWKAQQSFSAETWLSKVKIEIQSGTLANVDNVGPSRFDFFSFD